MEKKNKKQERHLLFSKVAIFIVIAFFACFNLSRADLGKYNIFQDRDQDGLSDKEEVAYGTDPENEDSDGDGYSDKVEIESGYDPLKPAPGDRIVKEPQVLGEEKENEQNKEEINLTEEFFKEIQSEEYGEAAILDEVLKNNEVTEEELEELYSYDEKGDLEGIIKKIATENTQSTEELSVSEDDIKIIPKPEGDEEEIRKEEKEQIEAYMSSVLYILSVNRPFVLSDINDLPEKMSEYIFHVSNDVQEGNLKQIQEYKENIKETFDQIKKLETPQVLVEQHLSILNVYQLLYNEIDEEKLLSDDDPIALLLYASKIEGIFLELSEVQQELEEVLKEYEIESFDLSSVASNFE